MYLGYDVLWGCGLGLGYLTPLATLLTWFADRRGLATGLAIAGFGGGAILGAPLAVSLMQRFASPTSVGVAETFLVLGVGSFLAMLGSALLFRLPPPGWQAPAGAPSAPPPYVTLRVGEAVAGPMLVNYMHEFQVAKGVSHTEAYSSTMYLMACLLIVGFLCNCAVQPISHTRARLMSRDF